MVASQTSAGFLFRFCLGHAVFYAVKVTDTFTSFAFCHVDSSARRAVSEAGLRNLHITADFVAESEILVDIGSYHLGGSDCFNYRCRPGSTVASGKYARNIVKSTLVLGHDFAPFNRHAGFFKVLILDILTDSYD